MSANHTPGPWQIKSEYEPHLIIGNVDGETITGFTSYSYTFDFIASLEDEYGEMTDSANARLILAAPELFEALTLWLKYDNLDEPDFATAGPMLLYANAIEATRSAIAKAAGQ